MLRVKAFTIKEERRMILDYFCMYHVVGMDMARLNGPSELKVVMSWPGDGVY